MLSNSHAVGNLARSFVYVGPRGSTELKGLNASVHLPVGETTIYVHLTGDDPELARQRVRLLRLDQTTDRRVVAMYAQNIFGGQRTKKYNEVAVTKADAEQDVWLKLTPVAALPPGEYGVVMMPKDVSLAPDAVYDFDVNLDAAVPEKH